MLKWLILGISVALVFHWSSKEVHADSPLTDEEQNLLLSLRSALNDNDKRSGSSSEECDCDELDEEDEECWMECAMLSERMIQAADEQEDTLGRTFGSDSRLSKKWLVPGLRIPPIRRIPIARRIGDKIRRIPIFRRWGKK